MSNIIVFAGTTEGKEISEALQKNNIEHYVSVATEYGRETFISDEDNHKCVHVLSGRLDEDKMTALFTEKSIDLIIDATHPYARVVSDTVKSSADKLGLRVIRIKRTGDDYDKSFSSNEELINELVKTEGNILLTTGSNTLEEYAEREELKGRLYVRVIPGSESFEKCRNCGIEPDHIIGMQGPFSEEMNLALIRNYNIKALVTKNSGRAGGFNEKLSASVKAGISFFCLERPREEGAIPVLEALKEIETYIGKKICTCENLKTKVSVIGIGMGNKNVMTKDASGRIDSAQVIIGAGRMLSSVQKSNNCRYYDLYKPQDILNCILENRGKNITVLMSGDSGFYSGCNKLLKELEKYNDDGIAVEVIPGISSVSYLAAKLKVSYEDAYICSIHGKDFSDVKARLWQEISTHEKSFILTSGYEDVADIYEMFNDMEIFAGLMMSYPEEKIIKLTDESIVELEGEKIVTLFIRNRRAYKKELCYELEDDKLLRADKVPMTKKEVRDICIFKLGIRSGDVVWDIGSGTGSVAVAIAALSYDLRVVSFEKNSDALELISKNVIRNKAYNIDIVNCFAPDYPEELRYKIPDRVFIGGSSGNIKEIITDIFNRNDKAVIVATAVTLETVAQIISIHNDDLGVQSEIIEVQVNRSNLVGKYHMMKAENPVYICKLWKE